MWYTLKAIDQQVLELLGLIPALELVALQKRFLSRGYLNNSNTAWVPKLFKALYR